MLKLLLTSSVIVNNSEKVIFLKNLSQAGKLHIGQGRQASHCVKIDMARGYFTAIFKRSSSSEGKLTSKLCKLISTSEKSIIFIFVFILYLLHSQI